MNSIQPRISFSNNRFAEAGRASHFGLNGTCFARPVLFAAFELKPGPKLLDRCLATTRIALVLATLLVVTSALFISPLCCQWVCTNCGNDQDDNCPVCLLAHLPATMPDAVAEFGPPIAAVAEVLPIIHPVHCASVDYQFLPSRAPPAPDRSPCS